MTATARVLPAETDDPREALLDLFEGQVRTLLAHGLEAPMRSRLARLLPNPVTVPPPVAQAAAPEAGPDTALEVTQVLTALGYAARARLTEPEHRCVQAARALVLKHLGRSRGTARKSQPEGA